MNEISPAVPAPRVPASTDPAESGPALLRPLRIRDLRLLFTGETVSVLGDQFHFVALTDDRHRGGHRGDRRGSPTLMVWPEDDPEP